MKDSTLEIRETKSGREWFDEDTSLLIQRGQRWMKFDARQFTPGTRLTISVKDACDGKAVVQDETS